jgi:rhodanese-related sulfurtransferase
MSHPEQLQENLPAERVADLLREGGVQLVDVREPHEHEAGRIAGSRHVELARLAAEAGSIDRERPVVFYCRVGERSAAAAQAFRASGYEAFNLAGGLIAWDEQGLPLEPDGGRVAEH